MSWSYNHFFEGNLCGVSLGIKFKFARDKHLTMSSINTQRETPDIETSSDDYARRFAGPAGQYFLKIQEKALQSVLPGRPICSVLDVGGGHGQLVPIFLNRDCALTIFGSDESTHRRVREAFPDASITYVTGDVLKLPYEDNSFDIACSSSTINISLLKS